MSGPPGSSVTCGIRQLPPKALKPTWRETHSDGRRELLLAATLGRDRAVAVLPADRRAQLAQRDPLREPEPGALGRARSCWVAYSAYISARSGHHTPAGLPPLQLPAPETPGPVEVQVGVDLGLTGVRGRGGPEAAEARVAEHVHPPVACPCGAGCSGPGRGRCTTWRPRTACPRPARDLAAVGDVVRGPVVVGHVEHEAAHLADAHVAQHPRGVTAATSSPRRCPPGRSSRWAAWRARPRRSAAGPCAPGAGTSPDIRSCRSSRARSRSPRARCRPPWRSRCTTALVALSSATPPAW